MSRPQTYNGRPRLVSRITQYSRFPALPGHWPTSWSKFRLRRQSGHVPRPCRELYDDPDEVTSCMNVSRVIDLNIMVPSEYLVNMH